MPSIDATSGWPAGGVAVFFIGGLFGSIIGIAGFGTAISGMVPGAILGFLSTWLVYRYRKRR